MAHLVDYVPGFDTPRTTSDRIYGPCPWCGGEDRFVIFPDQGERGTGSFYCFDNPGAGCGRGGDAIDYLREKRDYGFVEACRELGLEHLIEEREPSEEEKERREIEKNAPPAALWAKQKARESEAREEKSGAEDYDLNWRERRIEAMRERLETSLTALERHRRKQAKQYRRLRRAHRLRHRFAELHAEPPEEADPVSETARLAQIPDFVPKEDHPDKGDLGPKERNLLRSEWDLFEQPGRFVSTIDLYATITKDSLKNLRKARRKDEKEVEKRLYQFWKGVAASRLLGA